MKLTANGVAINYVLEGPMAAPVVTLAHSLGATFRLWDAQADALTPQHRVLRYDVRGHGESDVPPGPYSLEQMADDLHGLLAALGISETHFVGLSMGGLIGMSFALEHPRMVRSLTLCDTTSCYGPQRRPMWTDRMRTAEREGMEPLVERTMEIWFTAAFRETHRDAVDRVRAMLRRTDPRGYAAAIQAIADVDLTDAIGAIRCPTLVMVGEQDPGTPVAMARIIHARIAGSRLVVLPNAAHCSCVEAAEEFNKALIEFLAGVA
jgi:3-oxoadipate enol-lactonase